MKNDGSPVAAPMFREIGFRFTDDYKGMIMIIENNDGETFSTGLFSEQMNRLINSLLNACVTAGSKAKPENLLGKPFQFTPVPASSLLLAPSNVASETMLSVQIGPATLSFSVSTETLHGMCRSALDKVPLQPKQKPN